MTVEHFQQTFVLKLTSSSLGGKAAGGVMADNKQLLPAMTAYTLAGVSISRKKSMRCNLKAPRRAATAFFASVALLAAATAPPVTTAQSQSCVLYNTSSSAGNLWDVSIADPTYFGCADDGFLVAVESTSNNSVNPLNALSWTCSGGEVVGSFSSDASAEDSVLFTVGIAQVRTSVEDTDYPYVGDMYIGGYDADADGAGVSFAWKGPLGDFDDDDVVLPGTSSSSCGNDSFATGVTVWSSTLYVYGVVLECANVTSTCAPPNYPAGLLEDASGSAADNATTSSSSTSFATDRRSSSESAVASTDPPSSSASTVAATATPSSSASTVPAIDPPSSPESSTPSSAASTVPAIDPPSSPESSTPSSSASTVPAIDPPSSPASSTPTASTVAATDPPSPSSGGTVPTTGTPSPSVMSTNPGADAPNSSARDVSNTSESSTSSVSLMIIIGASVAGGLFFLAVCVCVACFLYRREERKARHPIRPRDTFGTPENGRGREGGGGRDPVGEGEGGAATHVTRARKGNPLAAGTAPPAPRNPHSYVRNPLAAGTAPPAREPPPPYADHPLYRRTPPSYPRATARR